MDNGSRISGLVAGTLLLLVGAVFVMQNLGWVDVGRPWDFWPLFLVWVGLVRMLGPGRSRHFVSGFVILLLGVIFQLERLDVLWIHSRDVWPFFLVAVGVALIADAVWRRPRLPAAGPPSSGEGRS